LHEGSMQTKAIFWQKVQPSAISGYLRIALPILSPMPQELAVAALSAITAKREQLMNVLEPSTYFLEIGGRFPEGDVIGNLIAIRNRNKGNLLFMG